jgi:hypothetical protein
VVSVNVCGVDDDDDDDDDDDNDDDDGGGVYALGSMGSAASVGYGVRRWRRSGAGRSGTGARAHTAEGQWGGGGGASTSGGQREQRRRRARRRQRVCGRKRQ